MIRHARTTRSAEEAGLSVSAAVEILDCIGSGVMAVDREGRVRFRNAPAAEWLPEAATLAGTFAGGRLLGAFENWEEVLAHVTENREPTRVSCLLVSSGNTRTTLFTIGCRAWTDGETGEPRGAVLSIEPHAGPTSIGDPMDVTDRLAALGKLAARVAHELNNPLDGILRYINLALRLTEDATEPKLKTYLSESRSGVMRMVHIIGDLLAYSRASFAEFDDTDVNQVIEQAIRAHTESATAAKVIVAADYRTAEMPRVQGGRLYQVVCNLIRNAIDAMPTGGRLTITSAVVGAEVVIEVADTGVGLPDDGARIFEPFYTTKAPGRGTGLGLAICLDFVAEMQGTINAASAPDKGTVFTVRVPVESFRPPEQRAASFGQSIGETL